MSGYVCVPLVLLSSLAMTEPVQAPLDLALIVITDPPPGATATLLADDIPIVMDLEDYLLVRAPVGLGEDLTRRGMSWRVIDPDASRDHYVVAPVGADRLRMLRERVDVLHVGARDAVIVAERSEVESLPGLGFEIARVFARPIRAPRAIAPRLPRRAEHSPTIQAMVDSISTTRIDGYVQRLQDFRTRRADTDSCDAAAQYLLEQFQSFGLDASLHDWHPEYSDNVVGILPGVAEPDSFVVLCGHFDSSTGNPAVCPGADDNASGTACVLECARILSRYEFAFSIMFIGFSAEEYGLLGSEAWCEQAAQRGDDILAALNVDMIGYVRPTDTMDLDIISNSASLWLRDLVMDVTPLYVPGFTLLDGQFSGRASDHASFWDWGYPAIWFFEKSVDESLNPHIHSDADTIGLGYNRPDMAELSVKTAAAFVATLAEPQVLAIAHTPLADTADTLNAYPVTAEIGGPRALDPDGLLLHYWTSRDPQMVSVPLTPITARMSGYGAEIAAQSGGTVVDYYLEAEDVDGARVTDPPGAPGETHDFFVGELITVFEDDLEVGGGWSNRSGGDDATSGVWVRVDPNGTYAGEWCQPEDDHTPEPGTHCYVTGNADPQLPVGMADVDGGRTTLTSPAIDCSDLSIAWLRYHRWYVNATTGSGDDVWTVQASGDGGFSWATIETLAESVRRWEEVQVLLTDHIDLGEDVRVRFIASDEGAEATVEAAVDDVAVFGFGDGATPIDDGPSEGLPPITALRPMVRVGANPYAPRQPIWVSLPDPSAPVTLRVYDLGGRVVATLVEAAGMHGVITAVRWDGRDDAGVRLGSGVYFVRLETSGIASVDRLILVR